MEDSIRDRIKELRRVRAGELKPSPANWHRHPQRQKEALRGLLQEIGYADALIAREVAGGRLELIDGHLRAETTPDMEVPVLILDVDEAEAKKILATLDPLAGMAEADQDALGALLREMETDDEAVAGLLADLAQEAGGLPGENPASPPEDFPEYDEALETQYCCPKCGYKWSGKPA